MSAITIAAKLIEGISSQGWPVFGYGGSWSGAVRPLDEYIKKRVQRAVKAEREACAKVCENMSWISGKSLPSNIEMAAAIRARSKT